jgi:hypothetical protein
MTINFVESTKAEIQAVAAQLTAREFELYGAIPTGVEDAEPLETFQALGYDEQPTVMEYLAFIVILLEAAGREDARALIVTRIDWFLSAYGEGAEPLAVAEFVNEN